MVMAVSLLIMRQLGGKWWLGLLAGAIVAWAPLFKETGISAIGAMGLFVIVQPIFKHRTWKQTGVDIVLLLGGAAASMAPLYIWIIGWNVQTAPPFYFVWDAIAGLLPKASVAGQQAGSYVSNIKSVMPFSEQWPRVLRFYLALCLPVSLALVQLFFVFVLRLRLLLSRTTHNAREKLRQVCSAWRVVGA